jgi:hypothetical protein
MRCATSRSSPYAIAVRPATESPNAHARHASERPVPSSRSVRARGRCGSQPASPQIAKLPDSRNRGKVREQGRYRARRHRQPSAVPPSGAPRAQGKSSTNVRRGMVHARCERTDRACSGPHGAARGQASLFRRASQSTARPVEGLAPILSSERSWEARASAAGAPAPSDRGRVRSGETSRGPELTNPPSFACPCWPSFCST